MAELRPFFLGYGRSYDETLAYMHERHQAIVNNKISDELIFLEHHAVITLTRHHMERSVKTSIAAIAADGIKVALADRGGDATFHGPGQLVGYPLIKLESPSWRLSDGSVDIERYIRLLERSLLQAVHNLGFSRAVLAPGFTGIWYRYKSDGVVKLNKLVAIGVGIKNSVTKHGFAFNIDIDHERFSHHIVPCGLKDRGVITLKEIADNDGISLPSWATIMNVIAEELAGSFQHNRLSLISTCVV